MPFVDHKACPCLKRPQSENKVKIEYNFDIIISMKLPDCGIFRAREKQRPVEGERAAVDRASVTAENSRGFCLAIVHHSYQNVLQIKLSEEDCS